MPESFNGALAVKADFRTGAIQAYLEGGALASRILTHPDAPNGRWYRGGFMFSGEASGALNPDDWQFSLEIIIT